MAMRGHLRERSMGYQAALGILTLAAFVNSCLERPILHISPAGILVRQIFQIIQ